MTQANPLLEYAQTHNPEAFAAVIQQYQRFVFATCRRKLHDPADLDDAVQETFLRLAQKAGELHSNIGGWLHRCAVNVALDLNRRREARKRHESTAASYRHEPIDDAQKALAELREQIDSALDKLSADQRELIVQRYFVGRAQVELATEAGVTPSAITHRLDRAIEALRSHLGQAGFSPAVAVGGAAAVEQLLQAEAASATVPATLTANLMKIGLSGVTSSAATVVGIGIMAKTLIGLAATLILGAGVWLAIIAQVSPRPASPATAPVAQVAPALAPTTGQAAFTVRGVVDDPVVQPPQWQAATQPANAQRAVLSGRIVDRDGKPVAGAVVGAHVMNGTGMATNPTVRATTDAQGMYEFPQMTREGGYRISVEAGGYVSIGAYTQPTIEIRAQSQARRDFVIERGVSVTVTVVNGTGQPLVRASVDITPPGDPMRNSTLQRKQTDDLGQAYAVLPVSKTPYVAAATMNGYAPVHQMITPESPDKPIEIALILLQGLSVPGIAICNDGKPATGWEIIAKPDWWSTNYIPRGVPIDGEGKFTLANISPGEYSIHLSKKGTYYQIATATLPTPDGQPLKLNIPEPSPGMLVKLAGRVTFTGGPQPDAVMVSASAISGARQFHSAQIMRGSRGRAGQEPNSFVIDDMAPGAYRITFEGLSIERKVIERFDVPGELPVVELKVVGKPQLSGTVVDASTGQPISHYAYRVRKIRTIGNGANYVQEARWTQISNPRGNFSVDLVGPGVYQVQASVEGYAWMWSPELTIEGGASSNIELRLTRGGALSGRVLDPDGKPIVGAKVIALSMARTVAMGYRDRFEGDAGSVMSDAQGRFTLPHLGAGVETIKLDHGDFASAVFANLKIAENQTTDAGDLRMPVGATVEGTIYNTNGDPVVDTLYFQDESGYGGGGDEKAGRLATAVSDEKGHYKVEHLPSQVIYIKTAEPYQRDGVWRRTIRPMEGKTLQLDFGGKTPVVGRIVSPKQEPLANRRVILSVLSPHFGPVTVNGRTDSEGKFAFPGTPPGRYTLYCESETRSSDWTIVRPNVEIAGQSVDLGDIVYDVGNVTIALSADDPEEIKSLNYVSIVTDRPNSPWQEQVSQAGPDGTSTNTWIAKNVPPGQYRVQVVRRTNTNSSYFLSFERKAGVESTKVEMRMLKPTATLQARITKPVNSLNAMARSLIIQGGQPSVLAYLDASKIEPQEIKLPAGTYVFLDAVTMKPRENIQAVTLAPNESRQLEIDPTPPDSSAKLRLMSVRAWGPTGALLPGAAIEITDQAGRAIALQRTGSLGTYYTIAPGRYQATINSPGYASSRQEFDVSPAKEGELFPSSESDDSNAIDLYVK